MPRPEVMRLAAEIAAHLERVRAEASEIERLAGTPGGPTGDSLWAAAAHLHSFYTGVEAVLARITRFFEGEAPEGPDSHHRLLEGAALELRGVRPPILRPETVGTLRPYLAFRHFFRHAYGVPLEWERMKGKAIGIRLVHGQVQQDFQGFLGFLDGLGQA